MSEYLLGYPVVIRFRRRYLAVGDNAGRRNARKFAETASPRLGEPVLLPSAFFLLDKDLRLEEAREKQASFRAEIEGRIRIVSRSTVGFGAVFP